MNANSNFAQFVASLRRDAPPASAPTELIALWWAKRGQWDRAHDLLQDLTSVAASRVHAHLHRIEGDLDNANYWYRRAGVATTSDPLDVEWEALARDLLAQASADSALR